jgi:hypothetical protein
MSAGGSIFSRVWYNDATVISSNDGEVGWKDAITFYPQGCLNSRNGKQYKTSAGGNGDAHTTGWAGTLWYSGATEHTWYNHILPPNSPSGVYQGPNTEPRSPGLFPPTSYHTSGVNVARCDASVAFVTETVDCGNLAGSNTASANAAVNNGRTVYSPGAATSKDSGVRASIGANTKAPGSASNFGVWGAFGSRDGGEATAMP